MAGKSAQIRLEHVLFLSFAFLLFIHCIIVVIHRVMNVVGTCNECCWHVTDVIVRELREVGAQAKITCIQFQASNTCY